MKSKINMAALLTQISIMAETNFGILIPPDLLRWLIAFTAAQVLFFVYVAFAIWRSKPEPEDEDEDEDEENNDDPQAE